MIQDKLDNFEAKVVIDGKDADFLKAVGDLLFNGGRPDETALETAHEKIASLDESLKGAPDDKLEAELRLWRSVGDLLDQYADLETDEPTVTMPMGTAVKGELASRLDLLRTSSGIKDWKTDGHDVWLTMKDANGITAVASELSSQGLSRSYGGQHLSRHQGHTPTLVFPADDLVAMDEDALRRAGRWIGQMPSSYFVHPPAQEETAKSNPSPPGSQSPKSSPSIS